MLQGGSIGVGRRDQAERYWFPGKDLGGVQTLHTQEKGAKPETTLRKIQRIMENPSVAKGSGDGLGTREDSQG